MSSTHIYRRRTTNQSGDNMSRPMEIRITKRRSDFSEETWKEYDTPSELDRKLYNTWLNKQVFAVHRDDNGSQFAIPGDLEDWDDIQDDLKHFLTAGDGYIRVPVSEAARWTHTISNIPKDYRPDYIWDRLCELLSNET